MWLQRVRLDGLEKLWLESECDARERLERVWLEKLESVARERLQRVWLERLECR